VKEESDSLKEVEVEYAYIILDKNK